MPKQFLMAPKYHLEEAVKWQIIGRFEAGQTIMEAMRCVTISRQTVSHYKNIFETLQLL